jgi:hypothetical protein
MCNPLRILGVHFLKILHIRQENPNFDDLSQRGAGFNENSLKGFEAGCRLLSHASFEQISFCISRQLA